MVHKRICKINEFSAINQNNIDICLLFSLLLCGFKRIRRDFRLFYMKIFSTSASLVSYLDTLKKPGKSIGFVPTMGALHEGHLALIKQSKAENDFTLASIYVNPLQFNNISDFANYPKMPEQDRALLEQTGCDILYLPTKEELFLSSSIRTFDLGIYDQIMEGKYRPGHFQGMANVVFRFFQIIQPTRAYFGYKDYQQFLIIKNCIAPFFDGLGIRGIQTLRLPSGLAMSSRNLRLTAKQTDKASHIYGLLQTVIRQLGKNPLEVLQQTVETAFLQWDELRLEYLIFAHKDTLDTWKGNDDPTHYRVFIAFYAGEIRLIDNIGVGE